MTIGGRRVGGRSALQRVEVRANAADDVLEVLEGVRDAVELMADLIEHVSEVQGRACFELLDLHSDLVHAPAELVHDHLGLLIGQFELLAEGALEDV